METGKYVVIEGTDGTGKSTQVDKLAKRLDTFDVEVVQFHEPDGVPISHELRNVIKNGNLARSAFTNLLLFSAARHENWRQLALPVLERGGWVLSARDYTSTVAYQGYGEGLDLNVIDEITALATDERYMKPDLTLILDIEDEEERSRRIGQRGELLNPDTFESKDDEFQFRVREAYRDIAKKRGLQVISASKTPQEVERDILLEVAKIVL